MPKYDALLLVSFGGPEGRDEVMPFLRSVVRGRNVPDSRLEEVAAHYERFGGISPINAQNRALLSAFGEELARAGHELPLYWGNRHWHPLLSDALHEMAAAGVRRALAFVTSAYSSYASCRQYLEAIERARAQVGLKAPRVDKLRPFFNHPGFVEANRERLETALAELSPERRRRARVFFCAHSIPQAMADASDYASQLRETAKLVAEGLGHQDWELVYQSRSGPPSQPWLEPDVLDALGDLPRQGIRDVVLSPIGFVSDHMEVVYDLDVEARELAERLGLRLIRAGTVGTHPRFVRMIVELVQERTAAPSSRASLGRLPERPDECPSDCCPPR